MLNHQTFIKRNERHVCQEPRAKIACEEQQIEQHKHTEIE